MPDALAAIITAASLILVVVLLATACWRFPEARFDVREEPQDEMGEI